MTTSIFLPTHAALRARALRPLHAVGVSLALIVLWALWAAYFNTAQFGDNIEQFNWAQSLELGYRKHPPLPSWLLGTAIQWFGPSVYWAYVLATLCLLGTAGFNWLIARELVGARVAAAALVLWGLNLTFSQRAQLYNHNTVLVLCMAASVWLALCATRPGGAASTYRRTLWWAATGVAAGAALLAKYQALVPLAGLLLALAASGRLRPRAARTGLCLGFSVLLLVCAPHAIWVAENDFTTLRYASEAVETSSLAQRFGFVASFFANQLRIEFPALLAIAVCTVLLPAAGRRAAPDADAPAAGFAIWMIGLVWAGLAVLVVMALAAGVSLRNHWGVQALQFFAIWLAWRWDRHAPIDLRRLVWVALAVHAASLAWYASEHRDPAGVLSSRRIDTLYPARRLAQAAIGHWRGATACPLRFVAGDVFDAGLVALYSGGRLEVFDTESSTPWVRPADLRRDGALYVFDAGDDIPDGVTNVIEFDVVPGDRHGRPAKTIRLGLRMPQERCD